ncbi:4-coumarate--CoA ligase-like 7 isoform X2 [Formica exsecta]|nr:4-coumarate--CoA ligase-like 7 isoform X2 [Formica exsecta]
MRERSVKCALWLKKLGVQRNDVIIVYSHNHFNTYIPYLATLYIGAILSVWHESRIMNLRYFLKKSSPKVIFTDFDKAPCILKIARIMNISTKIVIFEKKDKKKSKAKSNEINTFISMVSILNGAFDKTEIDEFSCVELKSSKDTAMIIFACGVTGLIPKDVVIPHTFFTAPSNQEAPVMVSNDVGLWPASLGWNISLLLTVRAILSYVKAIKFHRLFDTSDKSHLCNLIEKYKVTWIFLETRMCFRFPPLYIFKNSDISSLKQVLIGGNPFPNCLYKEFIRALPNISVIQVYCLPETGVIAYQRKTEKSAFSVGKNIHLVFVDVKDSLPVKPYKIGVLWCKSPSLLNAYSISTTPTKTITDKNGWFHTEDVGYYEPNGNIYILDRGEHNIKYKNHHCLVLEYLITCHPGVCTAAVALMWNASYGEHLMALIVRRKKSKVTEEELKQFVAKYSNCMHLRMSVLFAIGLPILQNGFLARKEICKMAAKYLHSKMPLSGNRETSL